MLRKNTRVLLIVLGGVLVLFFYLQRTPLVDPTANPTMAFPTSPPQEYLFDIQPEEVVNITVRDSKQSQEVVMAWDEEDESWMLEAPVVPLEDTNFEQITSMLAQILSLQITSTLEDPPDTALIGLKYPQYVITLTLRNGTQQTLNVGDATPVGSGYYVRLGDGDIVVVNKFGLDFVLGMVEDPPVFPTPTLSPTATFRPPSVTEEEYERATEAAAKTQTAEPDPTATLTPTP